ncbi:MULTISPECIES: DUF7059 domain-containing protein [unclassified Schaalia]|uniref:DUF7059 domain-containing protein n=1 Tax=unclassified Schaalia TaxID=2691889 RepID=UPI001E38BBA1|nr:MULTISPECIES: methyltransferase [unclassified Schaalia]MCD4548896.1 methyltransferase [Schaalia sp. lx-260]MCD4557512.1 methyltransferase [Schaalia sp. lx-100]
MTSTSTAETSPSYPVPSASAVALKDLRTDLRSAVWTAQSVETLLGPQASAALAREQRVPGLMRLADQHDAAAVLTRLFMLGSSESAENIECALPRLGYLGALKLGLITSDHAGTYRACFDMRPHYAVVGDMSAGQEDTSVQQENAQNDSATDGELAHSEHDEYGTRSAHETQGAQGMPAGSEPDTVRAYNWWVISDLPQAVTGRSVHPDHVMGIGGATTSLLTMTIRNPQEKALDLGCGCGIQALYLTTHTRHVVATDLSERACAITRFNAALNNVELDVRCGSLYEPVQGEKFDLIVSNPPFVITPHTLRSQGTLEYRDGGMQRDDIIGCVLREAPDYLRPQGVLQILANWEINDGDDVESNDPYHGWPARLASWCQGVPLDAWVVQRDVLDPAQYVELWMRDSAARREHCEYEKTYAAWLADFHSAHVQAIGMGFVACVPTPVGMESVHIYDTVNEGRIPAGHDVECALAALRFAENLGNLEDLTLVRRADVTEERHFVPGQAEPQALVLRQSGGMGRAFPVSTALSALVGASEGEMSVGQILVALSVLLDEDVAQVREYVMPMLPSLIRAGIVDIAEGVQL